MKKGFLEHLRDTAKDIDGKPRLSLVPPEIITEIGKVRTYGAAKYGAAENWRSVPKEYYRDAMMRHWVAYMAHNDAKDPESGIHHLSHCACNLAFLIVLEGVGDEADA